MTNVIEIRFSTPAERRAARLGRLLHTFAGKRRAETDVFWLKENGELLNVLESSGTHVPARFLDAYAPTYEAIADRLAFFPQYYRFILSIALDLETLGLPGDAAERMCDWIVAQDLPGGETSDIQRLEARRLLARRGRDLPGDDDGLEDRLRGFISQPARFALPNKKAAYELTHIVFYLSEYGRKDPDLGEDALKSLRNVGIWAFLDGNADLLAEICIAMRYAGHNPTEIWENWITQKMKTTRISTGELTPRGDGYHAAFMTSWLAATRGEEIFADLVLPPETDDALIFAAPDRTGALGEMSRRLYELGAERCGDWQALRPLLGDGLSEQTQTLWQVAEASCPGFDDFFESFARAPLPVAAGAAQ